MKKIIFVSLIFFIPSLLPNEAICLTRLAKSKNPISEFLKEEGGLYSLTLIQPNGKKDKKQYVLENGAFITPNGRKKIQLSIDKERRSLMIYYTNKERHYEFTAEFKDDNWSEFNYKIDSDSCIANLFLFLSKRKSGSGKVCFGENNESNSESWLLNNGNKIIFRYCENCKLESISVIEKQASDEN